jgi:hypothetical protein
MKPATLLITSLATAFALTACDNTAQTEASPEVSSATEGVNHVSFNEGTECYLNMVVRGAGLSCDFSNSTTSSEGPAGLVEAGSGLKLFRTENRDLCVSYTAVRAAALDCKFN